MQIVGRRVHVFTILLLGVLTTYFPLYSVASGDEKVQAAFAAIGAYIVDNQEIIVKSDISVDSLKKLSTELLTQEVRPFYSYDYNGYFALSTQESTKELLISIGKEYIEKLLKKVSKPFCKKYKLCKLKCYGDLMWDLIVFIVKFRPELTPIEYAIQTYVINSGFQYVVKLCGCA